MRAPGPFAAALLVPIVTAGCTEWQSVLHPGGPQAQELADLFWLFTGVCTVVWLLVMLALGLAVWRGRSGPIRDLLQREPRYERGATVVIATATAATVLVLIVFTTASFLATRSIADTAVAALRIHITGHQWWWDVRYENAQPQRVFNTANEIHVPVGRPVLVTLSAKDVIHSFWVPSLAGKQDLIPGRDNTLVFSAERPGMYRGQCAEFCGLQHAHMAMLVIAEPPAAFEAWHETQLKPASTPTSAEQLRGRDAFLGKACVMCHAIRGTDAGGRTGPDLTHFGSRHTIAAGTLPTTRGSVAAFIADPQQIKPGVQMPRVTLSPDELNAVAGYLVGLQ
jgi:cytochrome c oxidase subunit 2